MSWLQKRKLHARRLKSWRKRREIMLEKSEAVRFVLKRFQLFYHLLNLHSVCHYTVKWIRLVLHVTLVCWVPIVSFTCSQNVVKQLCYRLLLYSRRGEKLLTKQRRSERRKRKNVGGYKKKRREKSNILRSSFT